MLEEPQAAFYAWIERHPDWRQRVNKGDLVLVVDIGGGTTDFTLIAVTEQAGELQLERVAVGEHILLGGDNIDLALAHTVAGRPRRQRHEDRRLPASGALEQLPPCEGKTARSGIESRRSSGHHSRQRIEPDRRHDQSQTAPRTGGAGSRRLPSRGRAAPTCRSRPAAPACRKWACPTRPTRRSRGTSRASCARRGRTRSVARPAPDAHPVQRRRPACAVRARPPARSSERLARSGRLRPDPAALRRRSDARGRARRGLLRRGPARQRRAHSRRHRALLLRRNRIRHARRARHGRAGQSPGRRAVRHGGRHRRPHPRPRVRPDRRRAGRVPLLLLGHAQERCARRPDRRFRRRSRRALAGRSEADFRSRNPPKWSRYHSKR